MKKVIIGLLFVGGLVIAGAAAAVCTQTCIMTDFQTGRCIKWRERCTEDNTTCTQTCAMTDFQTGQCIKWRIECH